MNQMQSIFLPSVHAEFTAFIKNAAPRTDLLARSLGGARGAASEHLKTQLPSAKVEAPSQFKKEDSAGSALRSELNATTDRYLRDYKPSYKYIEHPGLGFDKIERNPSAEPFYAQSKDVFGYRSGTPMMDSKRSPVHVNVRNRMKNLNEYMTNEAEGGGLTASDAPKNLLSYLSGSPSPYGEQVFNTLDHGRYDQAKRTFENLGAEWGPKQYLGDGMETNLDAYDALRENLSPNQALNYMEPEAAERIRNLIEKGFITAQNTGSPAIGGALVGSQFG